MSVFESAFWRETIDRAAKSAAHGYALTWFAISGISSSTPVVNSGSYDYLFTVNNLKGAVAAVALSLLTSITARSVKEDKDSPSIL